MCKLHGEMSPMSHSWWRQCSFTSTQRAPKQSDHSLNGSSGSVNAATFNSYGNRQISTPYEINTPEPINKKFGTVDYVREGTLYTKFDTNSPTRGFWANGWNITKKIFFIYTFFFSVTRTGQTRGWIFTRDSSKDVKSRKDVPFGGLNNVPLNFGGKTP